MQSTTTAAEQEMSKKLVERFVYLVLVCHNFTENRIVKLDMLVYYFVLQALKSHTKESPRKASYTALNRDRAVLSQ